MAERELLKQRKELIGILEEYRCGRICYDKRHVKRLKMLIADITEQLMEFA